MGSVHEPFGIGAFQTGQTHLEVGGDAESSLGARTNADGRGHGGIRRNPQFLRRRDSLHGTDEACGVARRKQLFRVVARAAGAAEFLWKRQLDVQAAVRSAGLPLFNQSD